MAGTTDAVLDAAVDLAREAAVEIAGDPALVGEHLGRVRESERLVSHRFAATAPGYPGWAWTVTLARVPRGRTATVCEVDLLPGDDALLAPAWVPWADRLRPGDVGAGDVLPYLPDDERLDQGYEATGDEDADRMAVVEMGLGRPRVLSATGRAYAADRWYSGSHGPMAPAALSAAAPCSTCGFLVLLAGSLRTTFGVCANEWSPDDGRVVSMDHGCGAHSETEVTPPPSEWPDPPGEGADVELVSLEADEPEPDGEPAAEAEPGAEPQVEAAEPEVGTEPQPEVDAGPQPEAAAEPEAESGEEPQAAVRTEHEADDAAGEPPAGAEPTVEVEPTARVEPGEANEQVEPGEPAAQVEPGEADQQTEPEAAIDEPEASSLGEDPAPDEARDPA